MGSLTGHRASKTYAYTRGRPLRPSPGHTEFCFAISAPPKLGGCLTLSQSCPLAHWRGRWICGPPIATVRGGRLSANLNVARSGFLLPRKPSQPREVFNATVSSGAATGVPQPSRFHRHWPSCRMIALCYVVMLLLLTTFAAFASVLHSLRSNFAAVLLTVTFVAGSESGVRRRSSLRVVPSVPTLRDENLAMRSAVGLCNSSPSSLDRLLLPCCWCFLLLYCGTDSVSRALKRLRNASFCLFPHFKTRTWLECARRPHES